MCTIRSVCTAHCTNLSYCYYHDCVCNERTIHFLITMAGKTRCAALIRNDHYRSVGVVPRPPRPLDFWRENKFKDRRDAFGVCISVICGSAFAILGCTDEGRKREAML